MTKELIIGTIFLSPLLFTVVAILSWFMKGLRPKKLIWVSKMSIYVGILIAIFSSLMVYQYGLLESKSIAYNSLGLSIRLDALSVLIFTMINLISFVVMRFSFNYLDGDNRQGVFTGRLAATVASVQLLVLAGNLGLLFVAWVLTSLFLHRLLIFYPERRGAIIAARKKFIAARLSDIFLLAAGILLYKQFGTGNLEMIINGMKQFTASNIPISIELSAVCIALAAILKSALFPTHGWLVEVMETPTPVSALLHAGLLNAGPYLVARMAFVMSGVHYAPLILIVFGGFTALFASVAYLTQTSVKTALGYSSISHMGFSLLMCGFGVYSAAVLHLVAHSFYKAHAFLSSGSVIDVLKASRTALPNRRRSPILAIGSIILVLIIFSGLAFVWGINPTEELALLVISGVIVMGLSIFITNIFGSVSSFKGIMQAGFLTALVALTFFSLEASMSFLLKDQIPTISQPSTVITLLIGAVLLFFTAVILVQMFTPKIAKSDHWYRLAIHLRNGLYANILYDRLVSALYYKSSPKKR